jgi:hypothetical protein
MRTESSNVRTSASERSLTVDSIIETFYAARYIRIRHEHLVRSLQDLWRRQQGLVVAVLAFMGPVVLGLGEPLGNGVARAVSPLVAWTERAAIISGWFVVSSIMVMSLREAIFMMLARAFLDVLPIAAFERMLADARCVAVAYSLLWLPLAWALIRAPFPDAAAVIAVIVMSIVTQSAFPVMTWARAVAFAAAFALLIASADAGSLRFAVLAVAVASALLTAYISHHARLPRPVAIVRPRMAHNLAVRSALALPILFGELRNSTLLRIAAVAVVAMGGSAFARLDGQCGKGWGVYLVELVVFAWAIHRLPVLVDERGRASLGFLFRIPAARRRAVLFTMGATMILFASATWVAAGQWAASCAVPEASRALPAAIALGVTLVIVSLAALRLAASSAWASLAVLAGVALALGNAL